MKFLMIKYIALYSFGWDQPWWMMRLGYPQQIPRYAKWATFWYISPNRVWGHFDALIEWLFFCLFWFQWYALMVLWIISNIETKLVWEWFNSKGLKNWGPFHLTTRGLKTGFMRRRIGGRCIRVLLPGCSSIHTHCREIARHTRITKRVVHMLPTQTKGHFKFPHGSDAVLMCVPIAMKPKLAHGKPPKSSPKGAKRSINSTLFMNPTSVVKSPKTGSVSTSKPCLRWWKTKPEMDMFIKKKHDALKHFVPYHFQQSNHPMGYRNMLLDHALCFSLLAILMNHTLSSTGWFHTNMFLELHLAVYFTWKNKQSILWQFHNHPQIQYHQIQRYDICPRLLKPETKVALPLNNSTADNSCTS